MLNIRKSDGVLKFCRDNRCNRAASLARAGIVNEPKCTHDSQDSEHIVLAVLFIRRLKN